MIPHPSDPTDAGTTGSTADPTRPALGSATPTPDRIGGDVALESLTALGARAVVGLPGQHALGLFDALRRSPLPYLSARVENNAGFMADGLARALGAPAPLLLSTGPGALTSLAALQEAAASSVPVIAISAQVPVAGLGGGRHGYLHELPDQSASFRGVVKSVFTVRRISQIPSALAEAWSAASSPPMGPVLVEIPQDVLLEPAEPWVPQIKDLSARPSALPPRAELMETAAQMLLNAQRPRILAGGGVVRAGAGEPLRRLAEALESPVVTTFSGKESFPRDHRLSAQSWIEDIATTEFLEEADVLLIVGSGVGELSSNYHTFSPAGRVIHIEAELGKVTSNHDGLGIHADAGPALSSLADHVEQLRGAGTAGEDHADLLRARAHRAEEDISALLSRVGERLSSQDLAAEQQLLADLREAVPSGTDTFWDMTIAGYWAWSAWDPQDGRCVSAQGAGGLGHALPAAAGASFGRRVLGQPTQVLAVSGDGGALYGIAELAAIAQHQLDVTWLIIDDGGYGILRSYMEGEFGEATATELNRPDYAALAASFGIPAETVGLDDVGEAVRRALSETGPRVVVLPARLGLFAPTHLHRLEP
ncbi:thiamine pyrophosphate-binding protein [Nesterenkonia xinjiangensis]|uniref:Acetolactate synthase-1/2/3 large subunit n=1 Tax=Nesterenkonia xinjiangensis TaxID=225327 RepID=A0A7Z0GNW3_9MICC|nr:acetolactate synthase-1/2/3 large subunit [Nesterenkonia xinjiangensis]